VTGVGVVQQHVVDDQRGCIDVPASVRADDRFGRGLGFGLRLHRRPMLRAELCWGALCCPRPNVHAVAGDRGLPAQHNFGPMTALEPRARPGWCDTGQAWRFGGPTRSSTYRLSSVLASTYMSAESSDSWSDRSATVAMSDRPKICCADDSTIANAAFPTGRDQNASSQMRLGAQRGTQHSSARNIGRHMLRATYGDEAITVGPSSQAVQQGLSVGAAEPTLHMICNQLNLHSSAAPCLRRGPRLRGRVCGSGWRGRRRGADACFHAFAQARRLARSG
jgi:hypothetical protein